MAEKDQNTILPWQRIAIEGFQEIVHVWGCRTLSGLCKDGCLAQGTLMKLDPRCPDGSIRLETVVKMTGRLMTLAHVFFKGEKQQEGHGHGSAHPRRAGQGGTPQAPQKLKK